MSFFEWIVSVIYEYNKHINGAHKITRQTPPVVLAAAWALRGEIWRNTIVGWT